MKLIPIFVAALLAFAPVALAQDGGFGVEGYQVLEAELEELDLARVATQPGTEARLQATDAAITHRRELIQYISGWLQAGTVPDGAEEGARAARLILVENIVQLSVEIGRCDDARDSIALIEGFGRSDDPARQAAYQAAVDAVAACEADVAAVEASPNDELLEVAPADEVGPGETEGPSGGDDESRAAALPGTASADDSSSTAPDELRPAASTRSPAGIVLVGAGVASALGGAAWNLALLGDVSDYRDARDACEGGELELCADARELRADLASAKAPIGLLVGGGLALTAVGAILHVRGGRGGVDRSIALVPGTDSFWVRLRFDGGGAP